ncbi:MAG: recombination regulator RecX [Treponema sp.]|nr:recombination regulator RecX [Treponema sp.]
MIIKSIDETSYSGMFKVCLEEGTPFFIRQDYLKTLDISQIVDGKSFNEDEDNELLDAGLTCVVELKAVEYLARSEQSRFGLYQKLINKKYQKMYIEKALDYLEKKNYLSDERFSRAWLHSRMLNHCEGKTKLVNELVSRGISKEIAKNAVEEFFTENDEEELCKRAYEKFIKKGKSGDKLIAALLNSGFSYKMIKSINENL